VEKLKKTQNTKNELVQKEAMQVGCPGVCPYKKE
jgi:hypothetical protein